MLENVNETNMKIKVTRQHSTSLNKSLEEIKNRQREYNVNYDRLRAKLLDLADCRRKYTHVFYLAALILTVFHNITEELPISRSRFGEMTALLENKEKVLQHDDFYFNLQKLS